MKQPFSDWASFVADVAKMTDEDLITFFEHVAFPKHVTRIDAGTFGSKNFLHTDHTATP